MKHAVCSLIRIIAAALAIFGALEIGLEYMRHRTNHTHFNIWHGIIGAGLIIVGVILFAGSQSLADQLTDDIDEEEDEE